MTEEINTLKGTVSFTRKLSDGNYGSSDVFFAAQFDIADGSDMGTIMQQAQDTFFGVRSVVLEQLGVPWHVSDSGNVIVEGAEGTVLTAPVQAPALAAVETPVANEPTPPAPVQQLTSAFPGATVEPSTAIPEGKDEFKEWALARIQSNPDEFYDNRAKKQSGEYKANAPDFKHKATKRAVWL